MIVFCTKEVGDDISCIYLLPKFIMSGRTKLIIPNPPQYDVNVDSDLTNSIFIDMYKGAADNVSAIIQQNKKVVENRYDDLGINTTIAFVGGRGTGKSSAMHSFRSFLETFPRNGDGSKWISNPQVIDDLKNTQFFTIPTIDSSQISKDESIIGRMSAAMCKEYRKFQANLNYEQKQNFISCAKEVNEVAVMVRHSDEWFKTGDKLLKDTERVGNMRESVCNLVQSYLAIVSSKNTDASRNSYLIISIDDLDMGIGNAYPIMEEIRKYLSIPKVIVLVSIDNGLLNAVMYASIKNSLNISGKDNSHILLAKDLSYRYLEKLFPANRRHHTPVLSAQQLTDWQSGFFLDDETANGDNNRERELWNKWGIPTIPSVRDAVLHLIWRKTMLLLVCNREGDHLLIPRNLRSLCHMVDFLRNMPDIAYDDENNIREYKEFADICPGDKDELREKLRRNLEVFGQYVATNIGSYGAPNMSTSSEINMASVLEKIIHQIRGIPVSRMNALIVSDILYSIHQIEDKSDIYCQILSEKRDIDYGPLANNRKKHFCSKKNNKSLYHNILYAAVRYPDSISVGDVMYVLGMIDTRSKCTYIRYLVEVIRTLWSIRMTEEFFVNGTKRVKIQGDEGSFETSNGVDSYTVGITNDFRCAVGGLFVNPDYTKNFLPNMGWYIYAEELKNEIGEQLANLSSVYKNGDHEFSENWRLVRDGGRPYYRMESIAKGVAQNESREITHCNLFAIYTNLLTYRTRVVNNAIVEWQNKNIIALPFYSFDFLYRYYEVIHEAIRGNENDSASKLLLGIVRLGNPQQYSVRIQPAYIPEKFYKTITSSIEEINKIIAKLSISNEKLTRDLFDFLKSDPKYDCEGINNLITFAQKLDISKIVPSISFVEPAKNAVMNQDNFKYYIKHIYDLLDAMGLFNQLKNECLIQDEQLDVKDDSSKNDFSSDPDTQDGDERNENI